MWCSRAPAAAPTSSGWSGRSLNWAWTTRRTALGRTTTAVTLAEAAVLLDREGGEERMLLGSTDSAVDTSLAVHHSNATTILDDTEVGYAIATPLAPAAVAELAKFLNHEVHLCGQRGGEPQAA